MDRSASIDADADAAVAAPSSRARWAALAVVATLAVMAFGLWARYGSAVFVDALGAVISCF